MESNDSLGFNIELSNYTGSLEVLLDLAKSQKLNLEEISITKLADQFYEFITKAKNLNLDLASEYLVMATWLTYLKSKLLLPETEEDEFEEEDEIIEDVFCAIFFLFNVLLCFLFFLIH